MRKLLTKFAEKIRRFFYGRNGFDELAKHTLIASIVVCLIGAFIPLSLVGLILSLLSWALMIYAYYRILSKNIYKRVAENKRYVGSINMTKTRWQQRKTHRFYRCPECKTWLRVPKGRGKITITCVKCATKFDKRS